MSGLERRPVSMLALALLVGGSIVLAGSLGKASGAPRVAQAQTFNVSIDGSAKGANESFIAYFPSQIRVHAGDSVVFTWHGPGEPHTVTLGTDVDNVLSAFAKLKPSQYQNPPKSVIALDAKLPQLLPQGPGDAIQDAANPCVVASGAVPAQGACPSGAARPAFDGTQAYYNSGWKDPGQSFTVNVSSGTAPGTYQFMCLLHREGMTGKLTVVPSSTAVPSPAAQAAIGRKQLASDQGQLAAALSAARKGKLPVPITPPDKPFVLAGSGAADPRVIGSISEFGPKTTRIPVGGSVTWYLIGPHSITFNGTKADDDIRTVAPDGTVHLNPKALAPVGGPGEPGKPPAGGSPTKPKFVTVASSSWDGKGFHSSGVFVNSFGPPVIEGYKLTFTRAGKYNYVCTVHDNMKGTVVVG